MIQTNHTKFPAMNKTSVFLLLSALCAQAVLAVTCVEVRDNTGLKAARLCAATDKNGPSARVCYCVKNTQTGSISTYKGNNARFFSSSDCTGNFQAVKDASWIENTQWVNSISVGKAGISSSGPDGCSKLY